MKIKHRLVEFASLFNAGEVYYTLVLGDLQINIPLLN